MKNVLLTLSAVLILGGCSPSAVSKQEEEVKTSESSSVQKEVVEEREVVEPVEPVVAPEVPAISIDMVLSILKDSFRDNGVVEYSSENNTFILTPSTGDFAIAIVDVLNTGDATEWDEMKQTFTELSVEISKTLNDSDVCLAIANPVSTDKLLLIVSDGELLYDGIYEALGY